MLTLISLFTPLAAAFTEDVCFDGQGGIDNCYHLDQAGCDAGDDAPECLKQATKDGLAMLAGEGRSLLHVDATYLMAQAIGFSQDSSYWISAYNEAADIGIYQPVARDGHYIVSPKRCPHLKNQPACDLATENIGGLRRTNMATGGILLHVSMPHNDHGHPVDGLHPDIHDGHTEVGLANWRRWAEFNGPGCVAGITEPSASGDMATGSVCWSTNDLVARRIKGSLPLFKKAALPLSWSLGDQIARGKKTVQDFDKIDARPEARIGIYLHFLQDRISHHVCGDASTLSGPSPAGNWGFDLDQPECTQDLHGLRHAWEVGYDPALLDAKDRTTAAALDITWDELEHFAQQHGTYAPTAAKADVIAEISSALATFDPEARIDAMTQVADDFALDRMPGH
jgi:hypothetical protein